MAFSAGLGPPAKLKGPFNVETNLIYSKVLTNTGNAYNPYTGRGTIQLLLGTFYDNYVIKNIIMMNNNKRKDPLCTFKSSDSFLTQVFNTTLRLFTTGVFTAPVRGVYYIRFTASSYDTTSNNLGLNLYKNGHHLLHLGENGVDGIAKHVSSGVTIELMAGDVIYTRLPANYVVWDGTDFRTSFSGFLIFPM